FSLIAAPSHAAAGLRRLTRASSPLTRRARRAPSRSSCGVPPTAARWPHVNPRRHTVSETDDGRTGGSTDAEDLSDDGVGGTATDEPTTFEPEEDPDAAEE